MFKLIAAKVNPAAILILVLFNLLVLDVWVARSITIKSQESKISEEVTSPLLLTPSPVADTCPNSCILQIKEATASSKAAVSKPTVTPTKAIEQTGGVQSFSAKEFFVPLGSGSNATDDWADVAGVQAYIDSTQYSAVKSVMFEASVSIPTGNQTAYVRLYNATDKHPVWFSDVSMEGGTPQALFSKPITLDSGNKLYKVQMKTSLKYTANLTQARVHITTY